MLGGERAGQESRLGFRALCRVIVIVAGRCVYPSGSQIGPVVVVSCKPEVESKWSANETKNTPHM